MRELLGHAAALVLAGIGAAHLYWALGGRLGISAVAPDVAGQPLFKPTRTGAALVAAMCAVGSVLLFARIGALSIPLPRSLLSGAAWFMAAIFALRAAGDFRYAGFFKYIRHTRFAFWDTWIYSPLCLFLALACAAAALSPACP